uniref:HTH psq-type domain-containing protein n=1 Tax=Acrobeloides nanus TaxID=290746 RepID=A0A914DHY7_9BILA
MATPSKRKQQSISIETKRKIINESEAGKSYGKLAREYELPRSTVQTIVENKAKILEAIDSGIGPKRARLTTVVQLLDRPTFNCVNFARKMVWIPVFIRRLIKLRIFC